MKDLSTRIHSAERDCGKRANYHVYYRHNGKLMFDPSWEQTPQAAIAAMTGFIKEARLRNAEIVKVIGLNPIAV